MLCTGNTCRSPIAAALLARRLEDGDVKATVTSAGLLSSGRPATDHGVAVMAERGLDTTGHRSRRMDRDLLVAGADLVVGMARSHVREAVALAPELWGRAFTLKEIVRRGEERGGREPGETLEAWLARLHVGRRLPDLLGESGADDVADPIGGSRRDYERTAAELDDLTARLARLLARPGSP